MTHPPDCACGGDTATQFRLAIEGTPCPVCQPTTQATQGDHLALNSIGLERSVAARLGATVGDTDLAAQLGASVADRGLIPILGDPTPELPDHTTD